MPRGLDSTNPRVWGPMFWSVMYTVVDAYPEHPSKHERKAMLNYFYAYKHLLPCTECKQHYRDALKRYPVCADSKRAIYKWLRSVEKAVNAKSTQKPIVKSSAHHTYACEQQRRYTQGGRCICKYKKCRH